MHRVTLFCFVILSLFFTPQVHAQRQKASTQSSSVFWTGDGGKGKSIAILAPQASGLRENQNYLPALVQGELVSNFSTYSAISVLDRMNLEEQYAELFSGYYSDDSQAGMDLGKLTPTDYVMGGTITRTETGYALQLRITNTKDKMTVASYSGTSTFSELDNLTGIRRASLDLLQKMKITPTERTRTELTKAAQTNYVAAQTFVARGLVTPTEVESLINYNQAAMFDSSLLEAVNRSTILSANISSGNIGVDARNDIQWRRDWVTRLTETEQYFTNFFKTSSPSFSLFYATQLKQGNINYQNETLPLSFEINLRSNYIWFVSVEKALQAVFDGLNKTGKKRDWGLASWPGSSLTDPNPFSRKRKDFTLVFELVNERQEVIARQTVNIGNSWSIGTYLDNILASFTEDNYQTVTFPAVKADDITDRLTIRVASVNGEDPKKVSEANQLSITALTAGDWSFNTGSSFSRGTLSKLGGHRNEIPSTMWGEPVIAIGEKAFRNAGLSSVIIPDSVTYIGDYAFSDNNLVEVNIPNGVTHIGNYAFHNNYIGYIEIKIPDSVVAIGDCAFLKRDENLPSDIFSIISSKTGKKVLSDRIDIVLPDSVKSVGKNAFGNLKSVTIGPDVNTASGTYQYENSWEGFIRFYTANGRKAGIYTMGMPSWKYKKI